MKIAVIGTGGLVGSAIMRRWNSLPFSEEGVSPEQSDELFRFDLPEFDAASRLSTDGLISLRPDVILNLASINLPDWLESHPNTARTIHVQGAANLRHAAVRTGALLVQVGCGEVFYHEEDAPPHSEDDAPNPQSVYAITKLDSERAASEYDRHLIVRTSALFGEPGAQGTGNLVDTLLKAVRRTREIKVLNDTRVSLTAADDLVGALRFLIHAGKTGLYHVAPPDSVTPAEAAAFLLDACGLRSHRIVGITTEEYGGKAPRSRSTALDASRYRALPGSHPIPGWQEALRRFLDRRAQGSAPPLAKKED